MNFKIGLEFSSKFLWSSLLISPNILNLMEKKADLIVNKVKKKTGLIVNIII